MFWSTSRHFQHSFIEHTVFCIVLGQLIASYARYVCLMVIQGRQICGVNDILFNICTVSSSKALQIHHSCLYSQFFSHISEEYERMFASRSVSVSLFIIWFSECFQGTDVFLGFWPFGKALCKAVVSIDYYNMFTSTFTLTVMSMDRYVAVCHPVKALDMRTPHKAKVRKPSSFQSETFSLFPFMLPEKWRLEFTSDVKSSHSHSDKYQRLGEGQESKGQKYTTP